MFVILDRSCDFIAKVLLGTVTGFVYGVYRGNVMRLPDVVMIVRLIDGEGSTRLACIAV